MEHQDVPDVEGWRSKIQRLLERYEHNLKFVYVILLGSERKHRMRCSRFLLLNCKPTRALLCLPASVTGGRVSFNVGNDSPTLTGAKVTFTIDLEFPHNQKVQPNGEVVWAEDCIVNGK